MVEALSQFPDVFSVGKFRVDIIVSGDGANSEEQMYEEVTSKIATALNKLKDQERPDPDPLMALRGWRSEDYEIRSGGFNTRPLFRMERSATRK